MRNGTAVLLALACLYSLGVTAADVPREPSPLAAKLKEGAPAFTPEEASAMVRELIPLLEQAAGRKFKAQPAVICGNRDRMAASMTFDLLPQIRKLHPSLEHNDAGQYALEQAIAAAPLVLARYGNHDKALFLAPANVPALLEHFGAQAEQSKLLLKLVMVHELAHALQDQEAGLQKLLDGAKDGESSIALNALLQGHALYLQELVAKELKTGDATLNLARRMVAQAARHGDPMVDEMVETNFRQIFLDGRAFVAHHAAKNGMEKVWAMYAQPPADTRIILAPETYTGAPRALLDYARALEGLEKEIDKEREWKLQTMSMGPAMLRTAYARLEAAKRDVLIEKIDHSQALAAAHRGTGAMANFSILLLKDEAAVKECCAIMNDFMAQELQSIQKVNAVMRVDVQPAQDLKGIQAVTARLQRFELEAPGEPLVRQQAARIGRGRYIFEYMDQNVGLPPERIAALAEIVFKRIEALEKPPPPKP